MSKLITASILLFSFALHAQEPIHPKREFRAVWISNVLNIDWPSNKGLHKREQKEELIALYDFCAAHNLNAVIVQIRPASDALYKSKTEVWSEWLTGVQGEKPGYNPLKFMIKEAHKRGLEFHAWFNPYRAVFNQKSSISADHVSRKHPEWLVEYGKGYLLNPGIPEVRQYVVNVVSEVTERYDIDGVHFDDYFYPYPEGGKVFPDSATFAKYGHNFSDIGDWRRNNIDVLIKETYEAIQTIKPYVKFGISPFGVWRNKADDQTGSMTKAGAPTFDMLYADTKKWLQKGWVDYMLPQIYWSMDFEPAAFRVLSAWWAQNAFDRHVYIGHGPYKVANNFDSAWHKTSEIPNQIRQVRSLSSTLLGSSFFSVKSLKKNALNFMDSLREDLYQYPALPPNMPWKDEIPPEAPKKVKVKQKKYGTKIRWRKPPKAADGERASSYVVYRFKANRDSLDFNNPKNILTRLPARQRKFKDKTGNQARFVYYVSTLDRLNNESYPVRQE